MINNTLLLNTNKSYLILVTYSDLKAKARRWDEKSLNTLKSRKSELTEEIKAVQKNKRKESELNNIKSQISGLETRLKYSINDRDNTVGCLHLFPGGRKEKQNVLTLTPFNIIIRTKCDYVNKRTSKWARNCCPGGDTGWVGIPGHGVGVPEVSGSNPVQTTQFACPYFPGDRLETRSVRVNSIFHIRQKRTQISVEVRDVCLSCPVC